MCNLIFNMSLKDKQFLSPSSFKLNVGEHNELYCVLALFLFLTQPPPQGLHHA